MNLRVFRTDHDLRDALASEVRRITSQSPSPYLGVIGSPAASAWLLDRIADIPRLVVTGYPDALDELMRSRRDLEPAKPADLIEPLDLVVVLGEVPNEMPRWLADARGILLAPGEMGLEDWAARSEIARRAWTFVLETEWDSWQSNGIKEDT